MSDERRTLILNVNDSLAARAAVTRMLEVAGFDVREASTGREALEAAQREPLPDVVLLDVRLPDLDGFEVCRRLKADPRTAQAMVVHTSAAFVGVDKKVQGLESGADGYLTQPFEPQDLVATVRSLVRLQSAERALRERARELEEQDRRKDEFLAMLAHELRNPLAAIRVAFRSLERSDARDEVEARNREIVRRQTDHLARLVDDLLDVSRVTQGVVDLKLEPLELRALLELVVSTVKERTADARGLDVQLRVEGERVFPLVGDPHRLQQVFANLVDNACKYSDDGGRVTLTLRETTREGRRFSEVSCRDEGAGIEPEALDEIFQLFRRAHDTPRAKDGLGVGLTLARRLVELHEGELTAESDGPGAGSTFRVLLPLDEKDARADRSALEAPNGAAAGGPVASVVEASAVEASAVDVGAVEASAAVGGRARRVLIVEDDPDVREPLVDLFEIAGHQVTTAQTGREGVELALSVPIDVALVDVGLPELDGYEVARRIRENERGKQLHLVALTGYGSPEACKKVLEAGFDRHLIKPADPDTLISLVEKLPASNDDVAAAVTA